jgi:hypothetical protein
MMKLNSLIPALLLIGSVYAHANGQWIYFESNPHELLRSYYNDSFPSSTWSINDNCFNLNSSGFGSDLMTKKIFKEFELEFDWKLEKGGNSGLIFAVQTGDYYSYMSGPEIQLLDDENHPDGKSEIKSLGSLYGLSAPLEGSKKEVNYNKTNSGRLIVKNDEVLFYVNDLLISYHSLKDDEMKEKIAQSKFKDMKNFYKKPYGHVLFQDHGGKASFCNIRIREI